MTSLLGCWNLMTEVVRSCKTWVNNLPFETVCVFVCVTEDTKFRILWNSSRNIYDEYFILLVQYMTWHLGTSETRSEIPCKFEMWRCRRMEKIIWTDGETSEVLRISKEERNILKCNNRRKAKRIGYSFHRNYFLKPVIEGKLDGSDGKGEEGVSSYWMISRKREDTVIWKRKH